MICDKCGGKCNQNDRCSICNYDNSNVKTASQNVYTRASSYRSTRLTVFLLLFIVIDSIMIIMSVIGLFNADAEPVSKVLTGIGLFFAASEIVLCIFMLQLKKWALTTYIVLMIITGLLELFSYGLISILLKALLLYFIFKNDWEYFE